MTVGNPPAGPRIEQVSSPSVHRQASTSGRQTGDAAATEIAEPIADLVTRMAGLFNGNGDNAPSAECIDEITGVLQAIEDPARIPSLLIEEAVTHVTRHFTAIILGPFGPAGLVVAIFVGKFAGELTHQALDSGRNPAAIQGAESAIELAGALADARIDRLAESDPFRQYVSGLVSRPIAAIINRDNAVSLDAASGHTVERMPDRRPPAVTAVIAAELLSRPVDEDLLGGCLGGRLGGVRRVVRRACRCSNVAPARTRATRWGAFTARQRSWADSMSL